MPRTHQTLPRLFLEQDDGFEIETSMNVQALQAKLLDVAEHDEAVQNGNA